MSGRFVSKSDAKDDDTVVVALETARVYEEHGDFSAAAKWMHRAAAAARQQGRANRAGELSRSAARVLGTAGKFEQKAEETQVLKDIDDDDFSDQTIVETAAQIAAKDSIHEKERSSTSVLTDKESSSKKVELERQTEVGAIVVDKPTPLAPLATSPKAASHQAIRVAVKRLLGGNFEARPLHNGESPGAGEQEALLVPVQGGSKLA